MIGAVVAAACARTRASNPLVDTAAAVARGAAAIGLVALLARAWAHAAIVAGGLLVLVYYWGAASWAGAWPQAAGHVDGAAGLAFGAAVASLPVGLGAYGLGRGLRAWRSDEQGLQGSGALQHQPVQVGVGVQHR